MQQKKLYPETTDARRKQQETLKKIACRLRQYPYLKIMEEQLNQALIKIICEKEDFIASIGTANIEMPRHNSNVLPDPTYRKSEKLIGVYNKRIERLERELKFIRDEIDKINRAVAKLTDVEQAVIRERYFRIGKPASFCVIARHLHYSERQCRRMHKKALSSLQKILQNC